MDNKNLIFLIIIIILCIIFWNNSSTLERKEGFKNITTDEQTYNKYNETYLQHMKHAMGISLLLLGSGTKCLIHSIVPPLFETGVSSKLDDIIALVKRNETTD